MKPYLRTAFLLLLGLQLCTNRFVIEDESYSDDLGEDDSDDTFYDLDEDY